MHLTDSEHQAVESGNLPNRFEGSNPWKWCTGLGNRRGPYSALSGPT